MSIYLGSSFSVFDKFGLLLEPFSCKWPFLELIIFSIFAVDDPTRGLFNPLTYKFPGNLGLSNVLSNFTFLVTVLDLLLSACVS